MCRPKFHNPHPPSPRLRRTSPAIRNRPQGLTLVEMLIGMAITLVMMAAVVNLFANLGSGVRVRRAQMELGSQLRIARARLFRDLAGATCPAKTWQKPGSDNGYIEIIDGQWSDSQPSILTDGVDDGPGNGFRNRELDYASSLVPGSNLPRQPGNGDVTDGGGLGDHDCVLALTVRSDSEPFTGRFVEWIDPDGTGPQPVQWVASTIESPVAEVIWYVVENPHDGSLGEPGMRTLYRRLLIVAPWTQDLPPTAENSPTAKDVPLDLQYYRMCDVSFHHEGNRRVPNSLGDLTKRENRFAHRWNIDASDVGWPFLLDQNVIRLLPFDADNPPTGLVMVSPLRPFGRPFEQTGAAPDRTGEDVMLNDVLAWDLRVFDPGAPLVEINNNGIVLEPSDPGWNPSAPGASIVGFGSYVSLGWDPSEPTFSPSVPVRYTPVAGAPLPLFKEPHTPGWHPRNPAFFTPDYGTYGYWAVYDTWSMHYETDGIDQEAIDVPNFVDDNNAGVDQGTNKLDDILRYDLDGDPQTPSDFPMAGGQPVAIYGTDDPGERETSPPYDVPLRGMQVKIRVYDRDTRQIREATVTRNFVD